VATAGRGWIAPPASKLSGEIMAKLKAESRNALPASKFALPSERKFPLIDKSHAANAKARATQMVNKGKLSPASAAKIRSKANAILGE